VQGPAGTPQPKERDRPAESHGIVLVQDLPGIGRLRDERVEGPSQQGRAERSAHQHPDHPGGEPGVRRDAPDRPGDRTAEIHRYPGVTPSPSDLALFSARGVCFILS